MLICVDVAELKRARGLTKLKQLDVAKLKRARVLICVDVAKLKRARGLTKLKQRLAEYPRGLAKHVEQVK